MLTFHKSTRPPCAGQCNKPALGDVEVFPGGTEKDGLGLALAEARLANGKRLINHPAFPTFLAQLAREKYGEGGMLPSSEVAALSSREDEIVKLMRSDIDAYHKARNSKGQLWSDELLEIRRRKTGGKAA